MQNLLLRHTYQFVKRYCSKKIILLLFSYEYIVSKIQTGVGESKSMVKIRKGALGDGWYKDS